MITQTLKADLVVSRPRITLMMVLCGIVTASSVGAVSAATTDDDVPRISVKFDPQSLNTDDGARIVYRRIVKAAERVCPATPSESRLVATVVQQCRNAAIARAVQAINDPRLAAISAVNLKTG
jgi:UrcA family protein